MVPPSAILATASLRSLALPEALAWTCKDVGTAGTGFFPPQPARTSDAPSVITNADVRRERMVPPIPGSNPRRELYYTSL